MQQAIHTIGQTAKRAGRNIVTWEWTKQLLHWLIISAGTMSECAFLVASLWMSVNASVHSLVLLVLDEPTTEHITGVATAAYVALPELILGLAFVVTIGHLRRWLYDTRDYTAGIWTVLYAIPTLIFLILSLFTLGSAVASATFELPTWMLVIRALAGYMFAFTSLLYAQLGIPQEKDRLKKRDDKLAQYIDLAAFFLTTQRQEKDSQLETLRQEKETMHRELTAELARIQKELDAVCREKAAAIQEKTMLYTALTQTSEDALQAYGDTVIDWLNGLDKTVSLDAIAAHTGINKRRLQSAIEKKELRIRGTNKELVWTPSLREYLIKNAPKSAVTEQNTGPILRVVTR